MNEQTVHFIPETFKANAKTALADAPLLARCSLWPLHSESCRLNNKTAKDRIGSGG